MQIVHYPHPALRWKSKPITAIGAELRSTVREMFELMYAAKGIGLAANQVDLPYRMFVVNAKADPDDEGEELVFINPEITRRKGSEEGEEGCLSLSELHGQVRRADSIVVEAYDLDGRGFQMQLNELPARVVQHELDHLDGVLFVDRMSESGQRELEPRLQEFEAHFRRQQADGTFPSDEDIKQHLRDIEPK